MYNSPKITITVGDVNEKPTFDQTSISGEVSEGASVGESKYQPLQIVQPLRNENISIYTKE